MTQPEKGTCTHRGRCKQSQFRQTHGSHPLRCFVFILVRGVNTGSTSTCLLCVRDQPAGEHVVGVWPCPPSSTLSQPEHMLFNNKHQHVSLFVMCFHCVPLLSPQPPLLQPPSACAAAPITGNTPSTLTRLCSEVI